MSLEAFPGKLNARDVERELENLKGVARVHDLHVWNIGTTRTLLTAHLFMPGEKPEDSFLRRTAERMQDLFHIDHSTFQIETSEPSDCWFLEKPKGKVAIGLTPNRWRSNPQDGRSSGTLSQLVRDTLAAHGGVCTRSQLLDIVAAVPQVAPSLAVSQALPRVLDYMNRSGFIEVQGELIHRRPRDVGRPRR